MSKRFYIDIEPISSMCAVTVRIRDDLHYV